MGPISQHGKEVAEVRVSHPSILYHANKQISKLGRWDCCTVEPKHQEVLSYVSRTFRLRQLSYAKAFLPHVPGPLTRVYSGIKKGRWRSLW